MESKTYDVVIIGSGMGGLACGYILSKNGFKVCILEKNHQIGGNLQIFSRKKTIFDTGVHYIGGLDEGQNLYQFFKYFNLMDKLKLKRMDNDGFDRIHFYDEEVEYKYGQGHENFIQGLLKSFPEEEKAIRTYVEKIIEICDHFPLYQVRYSEENYLDQDLLFIKAQDYIESLTENERLRAVLSGNNMLYAGEGSKSPLYVHALIVNSYIESSYKVVDGGSYIGKYLTQSIREMGGELFKRAKVTGANYNENGEIESVVLEDGRTIKGKSFISNTDPVSTIKIVGEDRFRKAYINRMKSAENTISSFTVHTSFKPESFKYLNYNLYHFEREDLWDLIDYDVNKWPEGYMLCTPAVSKSEEWADGASIMTYMSIKEVEQWKDSFNTIAEKGDRGEDYEKFKEEKAQKLLDLVEKRFPGIRDAIDSIYTSTPLTFRDYIGNDDGTMYGMVKDANAPLKSFVNPKTKIPNLYLTGQNINLHGILGATVSAFVTCFEFIDRKKLIQDIKDAQ